MLGIEVADKVRESEIIARLRAIIIELKISGDPSVDFSHESLSKAFNVQ